MMGNQGKRWAQMASLVLLLSSCSGTETVMLLAGSRKKNEPSIDAHVTDYAKASCEYGADQGDPAAAVLPETELKETYFGKKFDQNLLKAVLTASAMETVRFAKLTHVDFFTVPRYKSNSCLMASFIPEAQDYFRTQFASVGESVLGLYLAPKNSLVNQMNESAVILVRQDVSRWVLVHEYMHHLFSKEVQEIGQNDEDLKVEVQKADDVLKSRRERYKNSKSVEDGREMLNVVKSLVTYAPELLKRFTLEEMAIETVLTDKLNSREFRNVPENQSINGAAYIYASAEKAEYHLIRLSTEAMMGGIDTLLLQEKLNEDEYKNYRETFKGAEKKIDAYRAELKNLKKRAEEKLRQKGINPERDLQGFLEIYSAAASDYGHFGCSHAKSFGNYRNF